MLSFFTTVHEDFCAMCGFTEDAQPWCELDFSSEPTHHLSPHVILILAAQTALQFNY